jgi:hypothetical protein
MSVLLWVRSVIGEISFHPFYGPPAAKDTCLDHRLGDVASSYCAYVAYATIQASRDLAVGAFTNLEGGQDLRDAVAKVALRIATRISTDKK